jgi:hypothetical protein
LFGGFFNALISGCSSIPLQSEELVESKAEEFLRPQELLILGIDLSAIGSFDDLVIEPTAVKGLFILSVCLESETEARCDGHDGCDVLFSFSIPKEVECLKATSLK